MKQQVKKSATKKIGASVASKPIKYSTSMSNTQKVARAANVVAKEVKALSGSANRASNAARNAVRSAVTKSSPTDKLLKNKKVRRRLGYLEA